MNFDHNPNDDQVAICPNCGGESEGLEENVVCPWCNWSPDEPPAETADGVCPICKTDMEPTDSQGYSMECPKCGHSEYRGSVSEPF